MPVKTTATKTETKRRKTPKPVKPLRRPTTLNDLERVTIWELIDRGDGKPPRFEKVTPW